jgi:hypothetical protein
MRSQKFIMFSRFMKWKTVVSVGYAVRVEELETA